MSDEEPAQSIAPYELDVYRIRGWRGDVTVSLVGSGAFNVDRRSGQVLDWTPGVRAVMHRTEDRSVWVDVASHRSNDFERFRNWAPVNIKLAAMRDADRQAGRTRAAGASNRAFDEWRRELGEGRIPWDEVELPVDDAPHPFSLMTFLDYSVAVGRLSNVDLLLQARRVSLREMSLERIRDAPPTRSPSQLPTR